jgi:hypothetical protein
MPPKARTCYICGRPTLLPGYERHVQQCRDLFEKREQLKPPKERRACPTDPMLMNAYATLPSGRKGSYSNAELDEINTASQRAWEGTLSSCQHCGRKFLPEKLVIHNRSCTASNPARRVDGLNNNSQAFSNKDSQQSQQTGFDLSTRGKQATNATLRPNSARTNPLQGLSSTGSYKLPDGYVDFPTYGHLIKCKECGRNFNEVSYEKYVRTHPL